MSEKSLNGSPGDWPCSAQICFLPSRLNVSYYFSAPSCPSLTVNRPELFDEYTRRQYVAKAPDRNPFGTEEEPANFNEFDIFTKVRFQINSGGRSANIYGLRSEFCNSLHCGRWETPIVSETG